MIAPAPGALCLRGLALGFSIAAPVGPIGILCIRKTLAEGPRAGLACGLGAATADGVYGSVAAFGITRVTELLVLQQVGLRLAGGLFLCGLGVKTFLARPAEMEVAAGTDSRLGVYASTFLLTLTSPMTILSFAAVFAGLGLGGASRDPVSAASLVAGIFLGSCLWWVLLSAGIGLVRRRVDSRILRWVNRGAGLIIAGFGVGSLLSSR